MALNDDDYSDDGEFTIVETVGELKALLADLPDDASITTHADGVGGFDPILGIVDNRQSGNPIAPGVVIVYMS